MIRAAGPMAIRVWALLAVAAPAVAAPAVAAARIPCKVDRGCPGYHRCMDGQCAEPPAVTGKGANGTPRVVFERPEAREIRFKVEVADDPHERARGLMFRDSMAVGWGMLFLYPIEKIHSFWMKNTYIPLDMVFLGLDGTVKGVVEDARPLDLSGQSAGVPSRDVLELRAGTARRLGIKVGLRYRYINVERAPEPLPSGR
jgi:uncharacterized membrane protein (UPF0127 family)